MKTQGLSEQQIGVVSALRPWIGVVASFAWGLAADYFNVRQNTIDAAAPARLSIPVLSSLLWILPPGSSPFLSCPFHFPSFLLLSFPLPLPSPSLPLLSSPALCLPCACQNSVPPCTLHPLTLPVPVLRPPTLPAAFSPPSCNHLSLPPCHLTPCQAHRPLIIVLLLAANASRLPLPFLPSTLPPSTPDPCCFAPHQAHRPRIVVPPTPRACPCHPSPQPPPPSTPPPANQPHDRLIAPSS